MIVVDTSAWIDLLRDIDSPTRRFLESQLRQNADIAVTELVVAEVLAGVRGGPGAVAALRDRLLSCAVLPLGGLAGYEDAATLYRHARTRGVTIRKLADCLVAVPAIRANAAVLHAGRDFDNLARVSDLRVVDLLGPEPCASR
ncbi:MAG: type II toxin-antitoxin system VapC family toxin [Nocardioides sp.]